MQVVLDTHGSLRSPGGRRTYFMELLTALLQTSPPGARLAVLSDITMGVPHDLARLLRHDHLEVRPVPFAGRFDGAWRRIGLPRVERLRDVSVDVAHTMNPPLLPSRAARRIVTLHTGDPELVRGAAQRRSLERADAVVVASERLGDELHARFGIARERLPVIPPGVSAQYVEPPVAALVEELCARFPFLQEPYLLAIGSAADARRSAPFLLEAYGAAAHQEPELPPLVLVPAIGGGQTVLAEVEKRGLGDRVFLLQDLPSESLPALYRGAEFLLEPSWELGFGLSVLEAAACGIPSIADERCGVVEVVRPGTITPPRDASEWAHEIVALHLDGETRARIGRSGQISARDRTWEGTARAHWDLYA